MLGRLGRPMTVDVLTKLEDGRRRIDVDDLIALAAALDVSPTRLLLCASTKQSVELLPEKTVSGREAWQWLRAEWPLDERLPGRRSVRLWRLRRFWQENATPSLVV